MRNSNTACVNGYKFRLQAVFLPQKNLIPMLPIVFDRVRKPNTSIPNIQPICWRRLYSIEKHSRGVTCCEHPVRQV